MRFCPTLTNSNHLKRLKESVRNLKTLILFYAVAATRCLWTLIKTLKVPQVAFQHNRFEQHLL